MIEAATFYQPLAVSAIDDGIRAAIHSINTMKITAQHHVFDDKSDVHAADDDTFTIVNIDADVKDPLLCSYIAEELFQNRLLEETKKRPRTDYMEKTQKHINPISRARCVDYLVHAAYQLYLGQDTLHLAINNLDRYLSGNTVADEKQLSLVGLSCMIIASKYEEVRRAEFDFEGYIMIANGMFSRKEFIQMEHSILRYLKYNLAIPTTWIFLERFVRAAQLAARGKKEAEIILKISLDSMASYIAELSLLSYSMLRFLPSMVAASSVFLAQHILLPWRRPWNATLQHYTGYRPFDLRDCVLALHGFCYKSSASKLPSIRTKYSYQEYGCVALKSFPSSVPETLFA